MRKITGCSANTAVISQLFMHAEAQSAGASFPPISRQDLTKDATLKTFMTLKMKQENLH